MTERDRIAFKLKRAVEHLNSLRQEIKQLIESEDCRIIQDLESDPGYLVVKAYMDRPPSPLCSTYIGEALYQFRSALDHLICCLTKENGKVVNNKREFPIFDDATKFRHPTSGNLTPGIEARIDGLTLQHQALVEGEQPFQGKYGAAHDDPLWWLYCLSNHDRHQSLHLVGATVISGQDIIIPNSASRRFRRISSNIGPFEGETEVARFEILPRTEGEPVMDVQVYSNVRLSVAFDQKGPGAGRPALITLNEIGDRVSSLIKMFL